MASKTVIQWTVLLGTVLLGTVVFGLVVHAQEQPSADKDRLAQCLSISDSLYRLRCYDQLFRNDDSLSHSDPLQRYAGTPESPELAVLESDTAAVEESKSQDSAFGSERVLEAKTRAESPKKITSTIVGIRKKLRGEYVFELANGQVWQQVEAGRTRFRKDTEVEILKSYVSYVLDAKGFGRTKVKRLE